MGSIRPRNIDRYRVRLNGANCGLPLHLSVIPNRAGMTTTQLIASGPLFPLMPIPCAEELLATGLAPGAYRIGLTNANRPGNEGPVLWAVAETVIGPDMEPIALDFVPAADIPVRLFAYEGSLPDNLPVSVGGQPILNQRGLVKNVAGREYSVGVQLRPPYYVHSMRYANQPVTGNRVRITPGAELEVVIDHRGATLTGSVAGVDDRAFVVVLPPDAEFEGADLRTACVSPDGTFTLPALPPGEYRVLAVPAPLLLLQEPDALARALRDGERITLQRGETRTLNLRVR